MRTEMTPIDLETRRRGGPPETAPPPPDAVDAADAEHELLYERWAPLAWRLVTGPLTPTRGRGYYSLHLHLRIEPVVRHMAYAVVPIEEQIAFLHALRGAGGSVTLDEVEVDPSTTAAGRVINEAFAKTLAEELRWSLRHQPWEEHRLGLPREVDQYPWPPRRRPARRVRTEVA